MAAKKNKKLLKISEVAQRAGVSTSTIKHYVNEGLLEKPVKTSPNMAYYDESSIEKIRLIKKIQKEKFLPLDVIKRIIQTGESYDEELEFSKAIMKSGRILDDSPDVPESRIEKLLGYPLDKIRVLEEEKVIFPSVSGDRRYYDSVDRRIIEIMKYREDMGLPLDYSIQTIRIYRDAIARAVEEDIRLFAKTYIGDIPISRAVKYMTEADSTLDEFIVMYRFRMLNRYSESAIREINNMMVNLRSLNVFPMEGRELPQEPPAGILEKVVYYIIKGEYDALAEALVVVTGETPRPDLMAFLAFSKLLKGNYREALKLVNTHISSPTSRAIENIVAAVVYLYTMDESSGISGPIFNVKRMLSYLGRIESEEDPNGLVQVFANYVCGAIYVMLPDVIDTCNRGIFMLSEILEPVSEKTIPLEDIPEWMGRCIQYEVYPVLEIRLNRFLAHGYMKKGRTAEALSCVQRIIELAHPGSNDSEWARIQKIELSR